MLHANRPRAPPANDECAGIWALEDRRAAAGHAAASSLARLACLVSFHPCTPCLLIIIIVSLFDHLAAPLRHHHSGATSQSIAIRHTRPASQQYTKDNFSCLAQDSDSSASHCSHSSRGPRLQLTAMNPAHLRAVLEILLPFLRFARASPNPVVWWRGRNDRGYGCCS